MINKRNAWITLVFIGLDILCIKGLMIDIKDARFILGLLMCMFLTGAFARRIRIKPNKEIQHPEDLDTENPIEKTGSEKPSADENHRTEPSGEENSDSQEKSNSEQ